MSGDELDWLWAQGLTFVQWSGRNATHNLVRSQRFSEDRIGTHHAVGTHTGTLEHRSAPA